MTGSWYSHIVVRRASYGAGYIVVEKRGRKESEKILAAFQTKEQAEEFKRRYRP